LISANCSVLQSKNGSKTAVTILGSGASHSHASRKEGSMQTEDRKTRQQAIENMLADSKALESRLQDLRDEIKFVKSEIKKNSKNLATYGVKGEK
jgi:HPt (histidine-containing phosphotransfer) domain-containing protein